MSKIPDISEIRSLVRSSFPELANARIRPIESGGTDNYIFRIDDDLCLRIAKSDSASPSLISREPAALKDLTDLPLEVPEFMARGYLPEPDAAPWIICTWLDGEDMESASHIANAHDARQLAMFLLDLQGCGKGRASMPAADNHWRGTDLFRRDAPTRQAIDTLGDEFDSAMLLDIWEASLAARACPMQGRTWIHGDLHPANMLVRDGAFSGVIDWGLSGLGDPACDLMAGYTLFDGEARKVFAKSMGADLDTWQRARGWALSTAVIALEYYRAGSAPIVARSRRTIRALLGEAA